MFQCKWTQTDSKWCKVVLEALGTELVTAVSTNTLLLPVASMHPHSSVIINSHTHNSHNSTEVHPSSPPFTQSCPYTTSSSASTLTSVSTFLFLVPVETTCDLSTVIFLFPLFLFVIDLFLSSPLLLLWVICSSSTLLSQFLTSFFIIHQHCVKVQQSEA